MIVRIFTFSVVRKNQAKLLRFMKQEGAWDLLRRIPYLRGAYLLRNRDRRTQYSWITIWSTSTGLRKAKKSLVWKRLYVREVRSGVVFSEHYTRTHYDLLLQHQGKGSD
jgi:hypothetical protein